MVVVVVVYFGIIVVVAGSEGAEFGVCPLEDFGG